MRSIEGAPRRHDRVWLDATAPLACADAGRMRRVAEWLGRGRACVVARRDATVGADACRVAIALPLAAGRERIAWTVARAAIVRLAPPLRLDEAIPDAPPDRRDALSDLSTRAAKSQTVLHVYGSFAWQAISGEPCVTPDSDVDLLWDVRDAIHLANVAEMLADWETATGLRADGEARFADGACVAWRELQSALRDAARVLVKRDDGVALEPAPWSRRAA